MLHFFRSAKQEIYEVEKTNTHLMEREEAINFQNPPEYVTSVRNEIEMVETPC